MNLLLVARRKVLLAALAEELRSRYGIDARALEGDLGTPDFRESLRNAVSGLEVGLAVYNAAYAPVGEFAAMDPAALSRVVDVNVLGPAMLLRTLVPPMIARRRGALILMSSLAGNQGSPSIAVYAASKAFNKILAESLWKELKPKGIDVVACCAGAVRTPGFAGASGKDAPGTMDPASVAERAVAGLGRGPVVVPGFVNKLASFFLGRLLSRRMAIGVMANSTKGLS
jgi:short-subunit dehydrogenase